MGAGNDAYHAAGPVTLLGGGPVPAVALAAALALAPEVVAADGGADVPLPDGVALRAVIGDMDSVGDAAALAASGVRVLRISEQDSTDFEKCLSRIVAPLVIGVGFLGGRVDHELAAMNALVKFAALRVVLVGEADVAFLCPPELALNLAEGMRVSFFPMGPVRGVHSEGLRWSVSGMVLAPDGATGTSNRALGGPMRVGFDAPRVVAILPAAFLAQVVAALADGPGWPG